MRSPAPTTLRPPREVALAGAAASAGALALVAGALKFGVAGLAVPLIAALALLLVRRPGLAVGVAVAAAVLCENADFGLFPQTAELYRNLIKGFTPLDALLLLAVAGVGLELLREGRPVRLPPPPLALASLLLALGLTGGVLVGRAAGVGVSQAALAAHTFMYVIVVPLVVVNLRLDERRIVRLLQGGLVLAAVKALIGLAVVASGRGLRVNGSSVLTYYEPTANWLMTVGMLSVLALVVLRLRPRPWMLVVAPLLVVALALSYRRSFWIGDGIGVVLVVLFGLTVSARRLFLPIVAVLAAGLWMLGGVALQSDTPLGERVQSLAPSKVATTPDDRYRLDERANVVAALREHPVSGLGLMVPWSATARSLPVEVNPDHQYVHFAALFWWLKLGILGLAAYVVLLAGGMWLAARVWRRAPDPLLRAFGLASLCGLIGLVAIESTATFSGSDPRFTVLLMAQLGLLVLIDRLPERG